MSIKNKSPKLLFIPFLILYIFYVLLTHNDNMEGDESRYVMFANNLISGFYSPPEELNLWNGPGYPLYLLPFVYFKLPLIFITLTNAVLQYISVVYLYKAIKIYANINYALILSIFWGFYSFSNQQLGQILTEPLTCFLITLLIYFNGCFFKLNNKVSGFMLGILLGYLVLVKIVFGYCVLAILILSLFLCALNKILKKDIFLYRKTNFITIVALFLVFPYLIYTYSITNRFPYFGNSGGMSLYWMSTPFKHEYGDWNNEDFNACLLNPDIIECDILFRKNHQFEIEYIKTLNGLAKDDEYKKLAILNIKNNPVKFFKNCIANISRMIFGFPFSYNLEKISTFYRVIPNSFILVFSFFSFLLWSYRIKYSDFGMNFLLLFFLIYLSFSTIVSAYPRQFYIIVPFFLVWIAQVFYDGLTIKVKYNTK